MPGKCLLLPKVPITPEMKPMRNAFDVKHPFFRPLWRRIVVVTGCIAWALVELLSTGSPFWAILFGAAGLWCAYQFFVVFDPADYADDAGETDPK